MMCYVYLFLTIRLLQLLDPCSAADFVGGYFDILPGYKYLYNETTAIGVHEDVSLMKCGRVCASESTCTAFNFDTTHKMCSLYEEEPEFCYLLDAQDNAKFVRKMVRTMKLFVSKIVKQYL